MTAGTLPVSEVFGPVWQGEGPHTGRLCSFLRLGLCNLRCSWCDTPYTWDTTRYDVNAECPPRTADWIAQQLRPHATRLLVLSGGEPLIHGNNPTLRDLLSNLTHAVHVETNGTLTPPSWLRNRVEHFTVSPKLAHGGDPAGRRLHAESLVAFADLAHAGKCAWKVVCKTASDVWTAKALFDSYRVPEDARWIMPEGTTPDEVIAGSLRVAQTALDAGLNLSLRQHTLMYGKERAK